MFKMASRISAILKMPVKDAREILDDFGGMPTVSGCDFATTEQVARFFGVRSHVLTSALSRGFFSIIRPTGHILSGDPVELGSLFPGAGFLCELDDPEVTLFTPNGVLAVALLLFNRRRFNAQAHDIMFRVLKYIDGPGEYAVCEPVGIF